MRSLLFVPGGSERMIAKAPASGADVIIFDLEDAVQPERKQEAQPMVSAALAGFRQEPFQRYVRVNALDTAWCEHDLEAVLPGEPDGIMLPKPNGPEALERLDALISRWETQASRGRTRIIAICTETASATLSLAARSWAHPRLAGLLWGGEDLAAAIGASQNRDEAGNYTAPFALARSLCLLAARAAGVVPIDAVFTDFRDQDGLARESDAARRDGFSAKAAIHPNQIEVINRCFTPTEAELAWAERVVAVFASATSGAVQLDGVMLDAPHLAQARGILRASARQ